MRGQLALYTQSSTGRHERGRTCQHRRTAFPSRRRSGPVLRSLRNVDLALRQRRGARDTPQPDDPVTSLWAATCHGSGRVASVRRDGLSALRRCDGGQRSGEHSGQWSLGTSRFEQLRARSRYCRSVGRAETPVPFHDAARRAASRWPQPRGAHDDDDDASHDDDQTGHDDDQTVPTPRNQSRPPRNGHDDDQSRRHNDDQTSHDHHETGHNDDTPHSSVAVASDQSLFRDRSLVCDHVQRGRSSRLYNTGSTLNSWSVLDVSTLTWPRRSPERSRWPTTRLRRHRGPHEQRRRRTLHLPDHGESSALSDHAVTAPVWSALNGPASQPGRRAQRLDLRERDADTDLH